MGKRKLKWKGRTAGNPSSRVFRRGERRIARGQVSGMENSEEVGT